MSDILDRDGLTVKTLPTLTSELEAGYKSIYGDDINVDPDTPDGQVINIQAQAGVDLREVLEDINAGFDPDQAAGRVLDQRVAINGIQRKGATFTVTPVSITVDRSVTLTGMGSASESLDIPSGVFTVKDDAGTQFVLLDTVTIAAGTHSLLFRAASIGAVLVSTGTITTVVTATAGVTAINNTSSITTQGVDEESDAALKIRRERSIMNAGSSYLDAIEGNLLAVDGVTEAVVYENATDTTDGDGVPPHSIWAIVEGGTDADIGAVLYAKKTAGAGFFGAVDVDVPRANGSTYPVKFDRGSEENIYVKFSITLPNSGVIDTDALAALIVENVRFGLGLDAMAGTITAYVMSLDSRYRITGMLMSKDDTNWYEFLSPTTKDARLVMDVTRFDIT